MAESKSSMKLRTVGDLVDAHEWLFNEQRSNSIDSKTADALNTTLKGATYLLGKLRLDYAKLLLQSQIKKINLPDKLLPDVEVR